MRKVLVLVLALALAMSFVAAKPMGKMNKGKNNQLYLYEKDASWDLVEDGAWGKLSYDDYFVFNGHGLEPGVEYTLINYAEPYPGSESKVLGTAVANNGGNVHIMGEMPELVNSNEKGAKIWLVKTTDFDGQFYDWNPDDYLFENKLI